MVYALKLASKTYAYTTAIQCTTRGRELIRKRLSTEDAVAIDSLVYVPPNPYADTPELKEVSWNGQKRTFTLLGMQLLAGNFPSRHMHSVGLKRPATSLPSGPMC